MKKCPNCGKMNRDDAVYCSFCRKKIGDVIPSLNDMSMGGMSMGYMQNDMNRYSNQTKRKKESVVEECEDADLKAVADWIDRRSRSDHILSVAGNIEYEINKDTGDIKWYFQYIRIKYQPDEPGYVYYTRWCAKYDLKRKSGKERVDQFINDNVPSGTKKIFDRHRDSYLPGGQGRKISCRFVLYEFKE